MDPQAYAAHDTLHARRRPFRHHVASASLLRFPQQTLAVEGQHGGQRPLVSRERRREVQTLRWFPVALPPDQQGRCRVRGGSRLVLRFRVSRGDQARIRRLRGSSHHGLFRDAHPQGRERDILGRDGRDGHRRYHISNIRGVHRPPYPQSRLFELPAPFGASVHRASLGRPHRDGGGISVVRRRGARHAYFAPGHRAGAGV